MRLHTLNVTAIQEKDVCIDSSLLLSPRCDDLPAKMTGLMGTFVSLVGYMIAFHCR